MTNKQHYERALPYLYGYTGVMLLSNITQYGKEYNGIELHCNPIVMDNNIDHLRRLLSGMGYSISGNKNNETITIQ